jgi:hypothetical protein
MFDPRLGRDQQFATSDGVLHGSLSGLAGESVLAVDVLGGIEGDDRQRAHGEASVWRSERGALLTTATQ